MTDNVTPFEPEPMDGQTTQTMYRYDEVVFELPEDRSSETVISITADFAAWWEYGSSEDGDQITLESRIAALEDMFLALM